MRGSCPLFQRDSPASRQGVGAEPWLLCPSALQQVPRPQLGLTKATALLCKAFPELCLTCIIKPRARLRLALLPWHSWRSPGTSPALWRISLGQASEGCCCRGVKPLGSEYANFDFWCPLFPMKTQGLWKCSPGKPSLQRQSLPGAHSCTPFPAEGSPHPGKAAHSITASLLTADSVIIWLLLIAN